MPAPAEHTKCSRNRGDACPRRRARRRGAWWLLAFILAPLSLQASAADDAATVLALRGAVIVTDEEGQRRKLEEGDTVSSGDEIETARRSWIRLEFTDGSRFDLGANTQFRVDEYTFGDAAGKPSMKTRIIKGVFRFLTGALAKRDPAAMQVQLSVAAIGIRGTHVGGEVGATSATVVLLELEGADDNAVEVANAFGSVVLDEAGYGTEIPDANSPPSPPRRMRLRSITNLTRTLQSVGRIRLP